MPGQTFSIVIPMIKLSYLLSESKAHPSAAHNNFLRFLRVGLPTLEEHLQWEDVEHIHLITPRAEVNELHALLREHVRDDRRISKFVILAQEDWVGVSHRPASWRMQMLLKLLAAEHVQTDYYLILDDDVVLMRPFGYRDLFADRACTRLKFTPDPVEHPDWWRGSANALGLDQDNAWDAIQSLRKRKWTINVTPEIMVREEVLLLLDKLRHLHGPSWKKKLLDRSDIPIWTEYTIYWLHLMQEKRLSRWYRGSRTRLSDGKTNIWFAEKDLVQKMRAMLANRGQYFGVIQSNVPEHTVDTVVDAWRQARGY